MERKYSLEKTLAEFVLAIFALSSKPIMKAIQGDLIEGWGIHIPIMVLGLGFIFSVLRKQSKQGRAALNVVSLLFALFTIFGQIYMEIGNWNEVFSDLIHFSIVLIWVVGYSIIYKKCILFIRWLPAQLPKNVWRRDCYSKLEKWLFETHPFMGTLVIVGILAIPWLVCFFPGTLEPDARHQLYMAFGMAQMTGHHPVLVTKLMGKSVHIGRMLFGSDTIGLFIYTFLQFAAQSLVVAYVMYVLCRMKMPVIFRWATLAFYSIYPIFPIWGYTMVKDSGYYILILLFTVALMHLLYEQDEHTRLWQIVLILISIAGICCCRKDGSVVVIVTLVCGFVAYKKYRKIFFLGIASCILCTLLINGLYMRLESIPKGSVKEVLSIPMQQTARYVKEHYKEITSEELEVLQSVFTIEDIEQLAELYNPELSDPVKDAFISKPDSKVLISYLGVWWQQLLKHPGTYVQAFLNHTYGYFYPDKRDSWDGEDIGVFGIAESPYYDIKFGIEDNLGRNVLEGYARLVKSMPLLGTLYSVGSHTWILLGCVFCLSAKKKWKEMVVYIPGLCIILVCMCSPVNACVRYMLPVMALLPVHLGWYEQSR